MIAKDSIQNKYQNISLWSFFWVLHSGRSTGTRILSTALRRNLIIKVSFQNGLFRLRAVDRDQDPFDRPEGLFHVFLCISVYLGLCYSTVERQLEAFDRHVGRSKAKSYLSTGAKNPVILLENLQFLFYVKRSKGHTLTFDRALERSKVKERPVDRTVTKTSCFSFGLLFLFRAVDRPKLPFDRAEHQMPKTSRWSI